MTCSSFQWKVLLERVEHFIQAVAIHEEQIFRKRARIQKVLSSYSLIKCLIDFCNPTLLIHVSVHKPMYVISWNNYFMVQMYVWYEDSEVHFMLTRSSYLAQF